MSPPIDYLKVRAPDSLISIFDHPQEWPLDFQGRVFLGRALLKLGKSDHGDAWADALARYLPWPEDYYGRVNARELRGAITIAAGASVCRARNAFVRDSGELVSATVRRLAEACASGRVATYCLVNGREHPIRRTAWTTPEYLQRARTCRIPIVHQEQGEVIGLHPSSLSWIWIDAADLERELQGGVDASARWRPAPEESAKDWCARVEVMNEAKRRARAAVSSNPSQKDTCRALARMWAEAGRTEVQFASFEQYLIQHRDLGGAR